MTPMAVSRQSKAVQDVGRAMLPLGDEPDGILLDRFIESRDEAAFAAIVRRHSALVWGVCRRVLGNHHNAEDALQATFLVLARKADSIRPREMVSNWLYGVAYRTALKAKTAAGRRSRMEKQVPIMPEPVPPTQDTWQKLEPLLDRELARLPTKYRVAVVLYYLQGKTGKEVARQLKIPEGTLSTRLRTARGILAKRLEQHRIELTETVLVAFVSQQATAAPKATVLAAINAAPLFAAGHAVSSGHVSAQVIALTEGALKAMYMTKIKIATIVVLLLSLLAFGGSRFLHQTGAAPADKVESNEPQKQTTVPPPKEKDDPKIRLQPFTVTGRAIDKEGKPLLGATIYLVSTNNSPQRLLGKTTTDKDGRYAFRDAQLPYRIKEKDDDDNWESGSFQVFGQSPELAFAWKGMRFLNIDARFATHKERAREESYFPGDKIELDLEFLPRKKIEGSIIDEKGQPIAGVKLKLSGCDYLNGAGKIEHKNSREFWAIHQAATIMPEQVFAKSDDKGSFVFPFVPEGIICLVGLEHSDYASKGLYTATVDKPPEMTDDEQPVLKLPLQLILQSVRIIRVKVQSRESGKPIEGIEISGYQNRASGNFSSGTSDKEGNVTLKLPPGEYTLLGDPPRTSELIRTRQALVVEREPKEQSVTLQQELGCVLILKAIDKDTGKGIPKVTFWYEFDKDGRQGRTSVQSCTSYIDNPTTNDKGELHAVVIPGKRRYGVGFGPVPEGYEIAEDDGPGRVLELTAGKTVTETFRLRKKQ
jgi:RNA polymerase sigma factor (sigma-70 family)